MLSKVDHYHHQTSKARLTSAVNGLKIFGSVTYSITDSSAPRLSVIQRLVNARVQTQPTDLPNKIVSLTTNLKKGVTA